MSVLSLTLLKNTNVNLCDILFFQYFYILNIRVNIFYNLLEYSEQTYVQLKEKFDNIVKIFNKGNEKKGGEGKII